MFTNRLATGILVGLAGVVLLGCAGNGAGQGFAPATGTAIDGRDHGIPSPAQLARVPSGYGDENHTRQGIDYLQGYAQNVHAVGADDLTLDPLYDPLSPYAAPNLAWAVYSFDIGEQDQVRNCNFLFTYDGLPEAGQCWFGFADWAHNSWEWHQCDSGWFSAPDWSNRISADGRLLAVVLYYAQSAAVVNQVVVELALNPIWYFETVIDDDSEIDPSSGSLALDAAGTPRIAFYDYTAANLMYAVRDGGDWQLTVVDSDGETGLNPQLALDSAGLPAIAYRNATQGTAMLASFDGASWSTETVAETGSQWRQPAFALDGADVPHLAFYSAAGNPVHAYREGDEWLTEQIDGAATDSQFAAIDLTLDASGRPAIVYAATVAEEQVNLLARFDGAVWNADEIQVDSTNAFQHTKAVFNTLDEPLVYYTLPMMDWNINPYGISRRGTEGWSALSSGYHGDGTPSLTIDAADRLHFCRRGYPFLTYEIFDGAERYSEEITDEFYGTAMISLALDGEQRPHLALTESGMAPYARLAYAYRLAPVSE